MRPHYLLASLMLSTLAVTAHAEPAPTPSSLRDEIRQLRADYEARMAALEDRLRAAEAAAATTATAAAAANTTTVPSPAAAPVTAGTNAFNPDVSLILSGLYGNLSQPSSSYRITGFNLPSGVRADLVPQRGFGLAESELALSASVDHLFRGALHVAIHPDNTVSTEEAFLQTTALPDGFTVKAGRFFSGIGYLNAQHMHAWDFVDAPLAYAAFLGGQMNQDGVQLRWLAPTDTMLELGGELGRGGQYPGANQDRNGAGAQAVFAHLGGDVGDSHSWRVGASYLQTAPRDREWDATDNSGRSVLNGFSGTSGLWITDGVWKWSPHGNATITNLKLQGEYLYRGERGTMRYDTLGANASSVYATAQSGWYLQGVYQWARYWRVGLRTERLQTGSVDYGTNNAALLRPDYAPSKHTIMVDYSPSEFSRIRLQYARDRSRQDQPDNQIFLQYQLSLGAHGAHTF